MKIELQRKLFQTALRNAGDPPKKKDGSISNMQIQTMNNIVNKYEISIEFMNTLTDKFDTTDEAKLSRDQGQWFIDVLLHVGRMGDKCHY